MEMFIKKTVIISPSSLGNKVNVCYLLVETLPWMLMARLQFIMLYVLLTNSNLWSAFHITPQTFSHFLYFNTHTKIFSHHLELNVNASRTLC